MIEQTKEPVKLDQVLKFLFSTSNQVLVKLLNGVFQEDFDVAEVELSQARKLANKLAYESKDLFEKDEILGDDFHSMLLAIQNLIEYLNRNYFNDEELEGEVNRMTKTLYDPEVEERGIQKGIEKGIQKGIEKGKREDILELLGELGEVPDDIRVEIDKITDVEKLKSLLKLAAKADSIEGFKKNFL